MAFEELEEDDYYGPIPTTDEEIAELSRAQLWDVIDDLSNNPTPEKRELARKIGSRISNFKEY